MRTIKIYKGCHYSNALPRFSCARRINSIISSRREVIFTDSCAYEVHEPSLVNKLFGFCFNLGVHKNSIRFGWTYVPEVSLIYLYAYIYENGKLHKTKIGSCSLNSKHTYEIYFAIQTKTVIFYIDRENVFSYKFDASAKLPCFYTSLTPYFGGNTPAPHTISLLFSK